MGYQPNDPPCEQPSYACSPPDRRPPPYDREGLEGHRQHTSVPWKRDGVVLSLPLRDLWMEQDYAVWIMQIRRICGMGKRHSHHVDAPFQPRLQHHAEGLLAQSKG